MHNADELREGPARAVRIWRGVEPLAGVTALILGVTVVGWALGGEVLTRVVTLLLIHLTLAVGLYMFAGNSGIMSFGHMSFAAIGAYTSALLTVPVSRKEVLLPDLPAFLALAEMPVLAGMAIGGLIAAAFAAVVSIPLMRMAGLIAAMATFAMLQITWVVARNWETVTRGTGAMLGVPIETTLGVALIWSLVAVAIAYAHQVSISARRLRASRDDENAARAVGVDVAMERRKAFVLSAFVVGLGGAEFGHFVGTFEPNDFYISLTFVIFAMLVLGGWQCLTGVVIGVVVVATLSEALLGVEVRANVAGLREIIFAGVMLIILVARPSGITGGREFSIGAIGGVVRHIQLWLPRRSSVAPSKHQHEGEES